VIDCELDAKPFEGDTLFGHTVNFRNTIIIMTSNNGAREITKDSRLGFSSGSGFMNSAEIEAAAMSELRRIILKEIETPLSELILDGC
jgi:ATP-dependent Clp protease ATP-binding subunit ClpC